VLDSMTPELPQSIRYLIQPDTVHPTTVKKHRRRQPRDRQMRERRTAYIMMFFGIVLGGLELFIVLSYV
jgi:hypothetical protein